MEAICAILLSGDAPALLPIFTLNVVSKTAGWTTYQKIFQLAL